MKARSSFVHITLLSACLGLASGCANGAEPNENDTSHPGTGGASSESCTATQKACDGACVSSSDPSFGCKENECAAPCSVPNAAAACENEACVVASCEDGWKDCDGADFNGCEVYVAGDLDNCGECEARCSASSGEAACQSGQCVLTCQLDHGDCDGDPSNGCEVDLRSDADNCGACGHGCGGSLGCGNEGVPGVCEAELLALDSLTNGVAFTRAITIDDDWVYYTGAMGAVSPPIYKVRRAAREPGFTVADGQPLVTVPKPLARLLVDDTYCYGLEDGANGGKIIRFDKTGASSTVTTLDSSGTALEIALHASDLYFLSSAGGVTRIDGQNGEHVTVAVAPAPGTQRGLAISGDTLYFPALSGNTAQLMTAPLLGGTVSALPVTFSTAPLTSEASILAIAAEPASVFFFDELSLQAFVAPDTQVLASDFYLAPRSVTLHGSDLYYSRWSGFSPETSGAIFELPTNAPVAPKLLRGGLPFAPAIAVGDAYVYSHEGDHVFRVIK